MGTTIAADAFAHNGEVKQCNIPVYLSNMLLQILFLKSLPGLTKHASFQITSYAKVCSAQFHGENDILLLVSLGWLRMHLFPGYGNCYLFDTRVPA